MTGNPREITTIQMGADFRDCPACGYKDGFHNMFRKTNNSNTLKWFFICPRCSGIFDIGLTVTGNNGPRAD